MSEPMVPIEAQIAEIERELAMRARVYPSRIAAGRMTEQQAKNQTAALEATLRVLRSIERGDLLV